MIKDNYLSDRSNLFHILIRRPFLLLNNGSTRRLQTGIC